MIKQIIITIIIALVFFGLGFISADYYKSYVNNTFEDGWDAAKQRLEETGFAPMMIDTEITSINGEVQEIKNNKIYIKTYSLEPLADIELDNRIIEIDDNTKIYQLVEKDQKQLQREISEFEQKMQEQMNNPENMMEPVMPPELYIKQEISLADIEIGQQIVVTAEEDIKDKKEFKAIEIIVQFGLIVGEVNPINIMPVAPAPVEIPPVE